jgi:hypothetical protein
MVVHMITKRIAMNPSVSHVFMIVNVSHVVWLCSHSEDFNHDNLVYNNKKGSEDGLAAETRHPFANLDCLTYVITYNIRFSLDNLEIKFTNKFCLILTKV